MEELNVEINGTHYRVKVFHYNMNNGVESFKILFCRVKNGWLREKEVTLYSTDTVGHDDTVKTVRNFFERKVDTERDTVSDSLNNLTTEMANEHDDVKILDD